MNDNKVVEKLKSGHKIGEITAISGGKTFKQLHINGHALDPNSDAQFYAAYEDAVEKGFIVKVSIDDTSQLRVQIPDSYVMQQCWRLISGEERIYPDEMQALSGDYAKRLVMFMQEYQSLSKLYQSTTNADS